MKQSLCNTLAILAATGFAVPCTGIAADPIPASLAAEPGEVQTLTVDATGVQIYACGTSVEQPTVFKWVFSAPEADLLDKAGKKIGRHYAGPTWEAADGSKVIGTLKARDPGPDPKAIPWLLLTAKSNAGSGTFGKTRSIQRLNTSGGNPPADGCAQAQAGAVVRVPYKATYTFYDAKP
jgi:hypothetical protein